jgi:proline iminopeptidase
MVLLAMAAIACTQADTGDTTGQSDYEVKRASGVLEISGAFHPYLLEGEGTPCVVTALGPIYRSLFSDRLKQHIQFVHVDFKNTWGAEGDVDLTDVTMETLLDDIDQVRIGLGHERICVLGHSAPGMMPLAYALAYPEHVSHAISIATVPFWNASFGEVQSEFWEADASDVRRAARQRNREMLPDGVLRSLTPRDAWILGYVRNGPNYWFDPTYDAYWIFAGQHARVEMVNHFFGVLLADYDLRPRLADITAPVFLAQGRYDYATPHNTWDDVRDNIPDLSYHLFERSAHFPMFEEQELFDELLIEWLSSQ